MSEENKTQKSRLGLLDGKTEITDEEIIALLDLPVEKRSKNPKIFTDKSYKELKDNPEELEKLAGNLKTEPEYLKYHSTYIAKSKLLYQESSVLYNEIPCLIILDKMNVPAYLLPYEYAKDKNSRDVAFADSLKSDVFTDFKRVFNARFKHSIEKGAEQGKDIFFLINNEKLNHDEIKRQLLRFTNGRKSENKEGTFLFFSEKDYVCYAFESDKNGFVTELPEYDLKQIRLANISKPFTPSRETENNSESFASNFNIAQENLDVNELLPSLLLRGEISILGTKKDIENRNQRYLDAVTSLENLNSLIQSETIKESNKEFVKNQKESRFYKDVQNLFVENTNQTKENKTMDETLGLDINTYTLQSGEKLSELSKSELMNYIHSNANLNSSMAVSMINRQKSYATEEESNELGKRAKSVTEAYRERDGWNTIREQIMNFDSYSRFVAANHIKPNSTEIVKSKSEEDVFSKEVENYSQGYEQFVKEVLIPNRSSSLNQTNNTVEETKDNPFLNAEPEKIKDLYEQSESVEKMQQEAAENAELDENGDVIFPKQENASVQSKEPVPKWKETLSNLMNMAKDEEEKESAEDKIKMQNSTEQSKPDIVQKEEKSPVSKLPKVSVKSYVSGQEFTGQNPSRAQSLRRELVENGTIKPDDDFVLVSEEQLKSAGCNPKSDAKSVSILCPPDEKNSDFHDEKYFHISAVDDIEKLNAFYNSKEIESISENPADYMETSEDVADFGFENDPNYLALEEMNNSYNEYLETEEGKKHLEEEAASVAETKNASNVPPVFSATAMKHKNFVEHAYEAGTKVPSFGYRNSRSGHTVILEGWEFCKTEDFATNAATDSYMNSIRSEFIEDKDGNKVKNPNYNPYKYKDNGQTVVLSKLQKETNPETGLVDEKRIYLRISAAEYNAQIENSCLLKDCAQITEEVKQEYLQKAHLDENEQRPNNSGNFTHNFNAYCRKGANNVKEAMDFGKRLIQNMRPEEREKLKTQMLKWEKLTGKSYTQRLAEEYKENVSDRPINDKTAFTKETLDAIRYNTETISNKGAPLDKSCRMKIGDTIKMKITVPDCLGRRNRKLPIQTLELVSHSPDGNSVVLMDEKHLSKYVIPRDDFIKTVQKQERKQMKAERREDRKAAISMSD